MNKARLLVTLPLMAGMLLLSGCGALATLDTVVTATEAAIPVLEAAGVPIPPQVPQYVGDVAQCIANQPATPTSAELLAISGCLAGLVAPTLTGLPATIVAVIGTVATDVSNYLKQVPPAAKASSALSSGDQATLQGLRGRASVVVTKAKNLRH